MKKYNFSGTLFLLGSIILSFIIILGSFLGPAFVKRIDFNRILCEEEEIYRNTSHDNFTDVVITESHCEAIISGRTRVYVVPKGKSIDNFYPFLISDHDSNLEVKWMKYNKLAVSYVEAQIYDFSNFSNQGISIILNKLKNIKKQE